MIPGLGQMLVSSIDYNEFVGRIDVGRIDLLPGYSLFDVKKSDAKRVVAALKGLMFFGKQVYSEIADAERDYASTSGRKAKGKEKKTDRKAERKGRK